MMQLLLVLFAFLVIGTKAVDAFSNYYPRRHPKQERPQCDRSRFLQHLSEIVVTYSFSLAPAPALAVFSGDTFDDAVEVLNSQRLACDNIRDVISGGNLPEAGFKIKQLNAQAGAAGVVALSKLQQRSAKDSVDVVRYLKCREKFALLLDLSGDCGTLMEKALRGELGATAVAQMKLLSTVDDVRLAFDDFLAELSSVDMAAMADEKLVVFR